MQVQRQLRGADPLARAVTDAGGAGGADRVLLIAAAIIEDGSGRLLFVRKTGTTSFMQPGGKLEPRETAAAALVRELHEELGLVIDESEFTFVGRFDAAAANEAGWSVDAHVFDAPLSAEPVVSAELDELAWVDPDALGDRHLAPLSREILVPLVLARRAAS